MWVQFHPIKLQNSYGRLIFGTAIKGSSRLLEMIQIISLNDKKRLHRVVQFH